MSNHAVILHWLTGILMMLVIGPSVALTKSFHNNQTISVELSRQDTNRLLVKGDKISGAHFPKGALEIEHDQDGGLYLVVNHPEPFTLYLDTEAGRHFSLIVSTDASLGRTIEFTNDEHAAVSPHSLPKPSISKTESPNQSLVKQLIGQMMKGETMIGFEQKNHYSRVKRMNNGLVLFLKKSYTGQTLKGERFELYNGAKQAIVLQEDWFSDKATIAISLPTLHIKPHETIIFYRVSQVQHGKS